MIAHCPHSEHPVSFLGLISRVTVKLWTFQSTCMGSLERYGESKILVLPVPILGWNKATYFVVHFICRKENEEKKNFTHGTMKITFYLKPSDIATYLFCPYQLYDLGNHVVSLNLNSSYITYEFLSPFWYCERDKRRMFYKCL